MIFKKKNQWYIFPFFLLISFILYLIVSNNGGLYGNQSEGFSVKDTLKNQPKVDIKVNKKYDEFGNLIQYDSSYSIFYSSPGANIHFFNGNSDSVMAHFRDFFDNDKFFKDEFFDKNFRMFDFDKGFFNIDPMESIRKMQERMKKFYYFPDNDSIIFNQQQQKIKSQPQNMITL
jgi:hypothetical protein